MHRTTAALTHSRAPRRSAYLLRALVAVGLLGGCAVDRSARVLIVHPSPLGRWGSRVAVDAFVNDPDGAVANAVRQRFASSGAFEVSPIATAPVTVTGELVRAERSAERESSNPTMCTRTLRVQRERQVPYQERIPDSELPSSSRSTGTSGTSSTTSPPSTVPQYRTVYRREMVTEPEQQRYPCTQLLREMDGAVEIQFRIVARESDRRVLVAQQNVVERRTERTTGFRGSDDHDHTPAPVDGDTLLLRLRSSAVEQFLAPLMPRREYAQLDFEDCEDQRCDSALALVRADDLDGATALYAAVIQSLRAAPSRRALLANALYNHALTLGYSGHYAAGLRDLSEAIALNPERSNWQLERVELQRLQREARATRPTQQPSAAAPSEQVSAPEPPRAQPSGTQPPWQP